MASDLTSTRHKRVTRQAERSIHWRERQRSEPSIRAGEGVILEVDDIGPLALRTPLSRVIGDVIVECASSGQHWNPVSNSEKVRCRRVDESGGGTGSTSCACGRRARTSIGRRILRREVRPIAGHGFGANLAKNPRM